VNKNIVVVLSGGSAVEMNWEDQCSALLYGCLSGQAGASAVINILTGKVNPSGKLSESIPLHHEDTPAYSYFPGREKTAEYRESLYVGYRYYDTASVPVRFSFGFGLSYTSFTYADLKLSSNKASFTLTNTGNIAGAEVVQLYIGKEDGTIFRPRKELKGFKKVFLEPGESKHVEIALNDQAYRYYNVLSNRFEIEGGEYQVFVGASSMDIRLTGNVKVKGTGAVAPYLADKLPSYYTGKIRNVSDEEFEVLLDGKIPPTKWDQSIEIDRNDSVSQLFYAKGVWGRLIYKVMKRIKLRAEKRGKPNLNILYLFNMPLRVLAKNSGGLVNMAMVDSIVEIMNGHFFRGFGSLITSWFNKRKEGKILVQQLQKNSKG
jgi:beta-glucosidase